MINNQLVAYVKQQLSINISREIITTNLKSQGWTDNDINEAFATINSVASTSTPISPLISGVTSDLNQPQATQANFPDTKNPKRKKIIPVIAMLILLAIVGGVAGYAYYVGYFVTLPSLLSGYTDRTQTLKSFKMDMNFNIDLSEIKSITNQLSSIPLLSGNLGKLNVDLLSSYDVSDKNNIKFSSVISADMGSLSLGAELKVIDNALYGQITKIPNLPIPMIGAYQNKWFSFPYKSLTNQISQFTPEEKIYLEKMLQDSKIMKTVVKLAPEMITGELSYHFSFDLDKEAFIAYMQSYKDYVDSIGKGDPQVSAFNLESFKTALDKVKDFTGEVWIGRNDKLFHKVVLNFGIQPDATKDEQIKVSFIATLSDYNQPVSIIAPTDSTPFADLMSSSITDAQQKGKEASIKANLSNMRAQAEIYWNSSNSYLGFCLSKELTITHTAIENAGGIGFVCKDTAKAYAIGVKLSQNSSNWCVDSTGVSKVTTTLPSGTVCPVK